MITGWDPYENIPETTRRGVEYIHAQKDSDKPFFLYFAYPSPHAPIIPNDKFDGKSNAGPYGDFVFETDDSIGQLLTALEDSGQADNTIIIFSADNGPEHYAYARDEKFSHWSSHPLRGLKRDIYEGGHRVPTIIKWPGMTKPGVVSDALVSQIDFMATIAAGLGYELPVDAAEDSHNLIPLLQGNVASVRSFHVHNTNAKGYAVRSGDWLLIDTSTGYVSKVDKGWEARRDYQSDGKSPVELYNLKTELSQKQNVAAEYPERVSELQALLKKIRDQGHSAPRLANCLSCKSVTVA
jgi:arylsulfatase A